MFFLGVKFAEENRSEKTWKKIARVKAGINDYVWQNYPEDIVIANNIKTFPMLNEIVTLTLGYEATAIPTRKNASFIQQNSNLASAIPFIEKATSKDFFDSLDTRLYPTYLDNNWSPQELERLIEKILEKLQSNLTLIHKFMTTLCTTDI